MSDFDPDAYLTQSSGQSFDPDAYLASPTTANIATPQNTGLATYRQGEAQEASKGQAITSGINAGAMDLLGLPMDTATNAANLVKAGIGYPYSKLTGKPVPEALEASDSATVPGTSEWIKAKVRQYGGNNLVDQTGNTATTRALHAGAEILGPSTLAEGLGEAKPLTGVPELSAQQLLDKAAQASPQSQGASAAAPNVTKASPELQSAIRTAAQTTGGAVNPEALARHMEADSLPVPMKLTEGQALQDPVTISNEQNMRLKQPELAQRFNEQNGQLVQNLQALRDKVGPDVFSTNPVEHGDTLIQAYKDHDAPIVEDIRAKYKALEDANGGSFPIDGPQFVQNAQAALRQKLKTDYVPPAIARAMERFGSGDEPMTFEDFESMRTNLAGEMRKAERSGDGNTAMASSIVRQQLENLPLTGDAANLKPLADTARSAAKARFDALRQDPAYNAAVNDTVAPDDFVRKYVIGGKRDNVATMKENLTDNPTAVQTLGVATLDHLRAAARIDPQGNGNFAAAGYNKAFQALSPKLQSLLDPETADQAEKLGNVARYTTAQPKGSAVNNSNTFVAQAAEGAKSAVEGLVNVKAGGIPVGTWVRKAAQGRAAAKAANQALAPGAGLTKLSDLTSMGQRP